MSPSKSTNIGLRARTESLLATLDKLQQKVDNRWSSFTDRAAQVTSDVIGLTQDVKEQWQDEMQLREDLAWVTQAILEHGQQHTSDPDTLKALKELEEVVKEAKTLQATKPERMNALLSTQRAHDVQRTQQKLERIRVKYLEAHSTHWSSRILHEAARMDELENRLSDLRSLPIIRDPTRMQLPAKPLVFHGREELTASIVHLLTEDRPVHIPLLGTGGIGKTTVAAAVINDTRVKEKFEEQIFFLSCEGLASAEAVVQELAAAFGVEQGSNAIRDLCNVLTSRGSLLLVVDNLETPMYSSDSNRVDSVARGVDAVEKLLASLASLPHLSLIITMRATVPPENVNWENIEPLQALSMDCARETWVHLGGKIDDKLNELLDHLGGLPLAIHLVARQSKLRRMAPAQLLVAYEKEAYKLIERGGGGHLGSLEFSVRLSLDLPMVRKEQHGLGAFSALCLLPDGAPFDLLPDMFRSVANIQQSISPFLEVALATLDEGSQIRVLPPIRDFILAELPPGPPCLDDMRRWFIARVNEDEGNITTAKLEAWSTRWRNTNAVLLHAWQHLPPSADMSALLEATIGTAWCSYYRYPGDATPLLARAGKKLEEVNDQGGVARCLSLLGEILRGRGRYDEAIQALEQAKASYHAIGSIRGESGCLRSLGDVLYILGRYTEAVSLLEQAKILAKAAGDLRGEVQCLLSLAHITSVLYQRHKEAIAMTEQAKAACHAAGFPHGEAHCMRILGEIFANEGRFEESLDMLEAARTSFHSIGNRRAEAQSMLSLGELFHKVKSYERAVAILQDAKAIWHEVGDAVGAALCLQELSGVLREQGQLDKSLALLQQERASHHASMDKHADAIYLLSLGDIFRSQKRVKEATTTLEQALRTFRIIRDIPNERHCLHSLGALLYMQAQYGRAIALLQQAKTMYGDRGTYMGEAHCLWVLAEIFRVQSRYGEALACLDEARACYGSNAIEPQVEAHWLRSRADILRAKHRYDAAVPLLEQTAAASSSAGDEPNKAGCLWSLGNVRRVQNRYEEAIELLNEAKSGFQGIDDPLGQGDCLRSLGDTLRLQRRYTEAVPLLEQALEQYRDFGNPQGEAKCECSLGEILHQQGHHADAMVKMEKAKAVFESIQVPRWEMHCTRSIAIILHAQGRSLEAISHLEEAKQVYARLELEAEAAECDLRLAEIYFSLRRFKEASRAAAQAKDVFLRFDEPTALARCYLLLGEVCKVQGDDEEARLALVQARDLFQKAGEVEEETRCEELLKELGG